MSENKKIMLPPVTERTLEPQRHAKLNKQPQLKHMLVREDREKALIGLALDKSKTYEGQQAWASIAKKFNGLGLSGISMICGGLALVISSPVKALSQCALCWLKLNATRSIVFSHFLDSLTFERVCNEVSRND